MLINKELISLLKCFWRKVVFCSLVVTLSYFIISVGGVLFAEAIRKAFLGENVKKIIVELLVLSIVQVMMAPVISVIKQKCGNDIVMTIREKVLRKIINLGPSYLNDKRTGAVTSTLLARITAVTPYFTEYLPALISTILITGGTIIIIFRIHWLPAVVMIVGVVGVVFTPTLWHKKLVEIGRETWAAMDKFRSDFLDNIQGMETLKQLKSFRHSGSKMNEASSELYEKSIATLSKELFQKFFEYFFEGLGYVLPSVCTVVLVSKGLVDRTDLSLVFFLSISGFAPVKPLITAWNLGLHGMMVSKPIYNLLNEERTMLNKVNLDKQTFSSNLCIKDLNFSYEPNEELLFKDLWLTLKEGKITALVGHSGSGKSTLVKIIAGLLPYSSGTISMKGVPLDEEHLQQWLSNLGIVWQDSKVFATTIGDNIEMGRPGASRNEILEAAKLARLGDLIARLPEGLDTKIGDLGFNLSGGEKQRICLARCFLRDAKVIILDEATSSLDEENQKEIVEVVETLMKDKTVLVIAHRLSTVLCAHEILLMNHGKIIDKGKHEELLERNWIYQNLIKLQFAGRDS